MTRLPRALASALFLVFVTTIPAKADSVLLTFEGITADTFVGNHYLNRYGIAFDNAFTNSDSGNIVVGIGFALEPKPMIIDVTDGFKSSVSFDYLAGIAGSFTVYSGADGTGSVLGMMGLPETCVFAGLDCHWQHVNLDFPGTAQSAVFAGSHSDIIFDNIQLDLTRTVHIVTPEPTSLLLVGTGIAGILTRARKFIRRR